MINVPTMMMTQAVPGIPPTNALASAATAMADHYCPVKSRTKSIG
jgi:hypothetical protein